jgi:hypothetical protein
MAMEIELARNINRAKRAMRGGAVGSGRSGANIGTEAWLGATGAAGLAEIQAALAMENERARAEAQRALGTLGLEQQRVLGGLDAAIADALAAEAMFEADPLLYETDPFMDFYLDWALAGEQEWARALESGQEALEHQSGLTPEDVVGGILGVLSPDIFHLG